MQEALWAIILCWHYFILGTVAVLAFAQVAELWERNKDD